MKPHLIILGPPGSGKGTQAARLIQKGFKHISTGDLLRNEIAKGSELGRKVTGILERGDLVDDHVVMELLKANCDVDNISYIFDGFPRNLQQAKMLEEKLLSNRKVRAVYFNVDIKILTDRIVNRRVCDECGEIYNLITKAPLEVNKCDRCKKVGSIKQRKDDTLEVVSNRLKIFVNTVNPILAFYKEKGVLIEIDASLQEKEIFDKLEKVIQ